MCSRKFGLYPSPRRLNIISQASHADSISFTNDWCECGHMTHFCSKGPERSLLGTSRNDFSPWWRRRRGGWGMRGSRMRRRREKKVEDEGGKKEKKQQHKGSTLLPVWVQLCEDMMLGAMTVILWPWNENQKNHREADPERRYQLCCWINKPWNHLFPDFCYANNNLLFLGSIQHPISYSKKHPNW